MEYYSNHKKEKNPAICSNLDGTRHDHTQWCKSERERQMPSDITYMRNQKYDANELIYKTEIEVQRTDL